jgi:hypothetical protein
MTVKGSTKERGYTGGHVKLRRRWRPAVAAGQANCHEIICLHESRWIAPGSKWDLAHDRVNGGYRGPAHISCNRAEGARWGNQLRARRRAKIRNVLRQPPRHW